MKKLNTGLSAADDFQALKLAMLLRGGCKLIFCEISPMSDEAEHVKVAESAVWIDSWYRYSHVIHDVIQTPDGEIITHTSTEDKITKNVLINIMKRIITFMDVLKLEKIWPVFPGYGYFYNEWKLGVQDKPLSTLAPYTGHHWLASKSFSSSPAARCSYTVYYRVSPDFINDHPITKQTLKSCIDRLKKGGSSVVSDPFRAEQRRVLLNEVKDALKFEPHILKKAVDEINGSSADMLYLTNDVDFIQQHIIQGLMNVKYHFPEEIEDRIIKSSLRSVHTASTSGSDLILLVIEDFIEDGRMKRAVDALKLLDQDTEWMGLEYLLLLLLSSMIYKLV